MHSMITSCIFLALLSIVLCSTTTHSVKHLTLDDHVVKNKRVLVIGDVHGCKKNLLDLLQKAAVLTDDGSEKVVSDAVVILAGDTINRGPDNLKVLRWLRRNLPTGRVFAVRGNHENYVIANPDEYEWAKMASPEDLAFLTTFPYTISIPLHDAIVVHAGLLPDRSFTNQTVFTMTRMRNIEVVNGELIPRQESRGPGENWGVVYSRLGVGKPHVYYGHDEGRGTNGPQRHERATGLDTRCVVNGHLTGVILPANKEEFYHTKCP